jgi:hypothetical protein
MWKKGTKLIFYKNGEIDCTEDNGFTIGKTYIIVKRTEVEYDDDGNHYSSDDEVQDLDGYKYAVINDNGDSWWIEPYCFKEYTKKIPKNEIDFLDNIQENFREGY